MIVLDGHIGFITALAYSPDGSTLAAADSEGRVKLWDPLAGRERSSCVPLHTGGASTLLSFSGDGRLVAGGFQCEALVWSAPSGDVLHWHRLSLEGSSHDATFAAFHPSEDRLAIASGSFPVFEVEPRGDRRLQTLKCEFPTYPWQKPIIWRSLLHGGPIVAAGCSDSIRVWSQSRADGLPYDLHWPNGDFVSLALDAEGQLLAGGRGKGVAIWDLTQLGPEIKRYRTFKTGEQVNAVALTPDGRRLLAGGDDWTIHVWDVASGQKMTDFNWRVGPVTALAIAPDGMTAAVGGRKGGQVVVWDLE